MRLFIKVKNRAEPRVRDFEWTWTTALVRGESNATVYARSDNPRGFWWCTTIKVVIHAILTLGVLIVLLET